MTEDYMGNALDYLHGYTDAFNGVEPARDNEKYREGYRDGKAAQPEQQPAPFCAPGDDDCEACQ